MAVGAMRVRDFQMSSGVDRVGIEINRSIGYLSERVYLCLAKSKPEADYAKLQITLLTASEEPRRHHVTLAPPICEVFVESLKWSAFLGPEPIRRACAVEAVNQAFAYLQPVLPKGSAQLQEIVRAAWATPPPYRFELTRGRRRHGRSLFRVFYVFSPDSTSIELEMQQPSEQTRWFTVRHVDSFEPLSVWFPVRRIASTIDGITFEDRFGRTIDLLLVPRQ